MQKIFKLMLTGYAGLLLPLAVIIILIEKILHLVTPLVHSIESKLHLQSIMGVAALSVISIIVMLAIGVLAGGMLKLSFIKKWIGKLENNFLRRIPLYNMLKTVASEQAGDKNTTNWRPALVRDEDAFYLGKIVDESKHYYTIKSGDAGLYSSGGENKIVAKNRVILINMSMLEFNKYEKLHGGNCAELVEKYTFGENQSNTN